MTTKPATKIEEFPITIPTPAELLNRPSREFTFGEWVEANGFDVETAVAALEELVMDGTYPYLQQPESNSEDDGVYDGGFGILDGKTYYEGADGPSGGTRGVIRRRLVRFSDVIELF